MRTGCGSQREVARGSASGIGRSLRTSSGAARHRRSYRRKTDRQPCRRADTCDAHAMKEWQATLLVALVAVTIVLVGWVVLSPPPLTCAERGMAEWECVEP